MRNVLIVVLGIASLGIWFAPAFGEIKTSMQKNAERNIRDDSARRSIHAAKKRKSPRTVPYGTGVYTLVQ